MMNLNMSYIYIHIYIYVYKYIYIYLRLQGFPFRFQRAPSAGAQEPSKEVLQEILGDGADAKWKEVDQALDGDGELDLTMTMGKPWENGGKSGYWQHE